MSDEKKRLFVVFIDSFGPDDLEKTEYLKENYKSGTLDAGNPYVTPKVMGEIYTGENPAVHGLPAVSRYNEGARLRPARLTAPEIAAVDETYENVCQFDLPFIVPPEISEIGKYWHSSDAMGEGAIYPGNNQAQMTVVGPAGQLDDPDEDGNTLFNLRHDYTQAKFATARTLAEAHDFEVMFISYRILDSYCHYRFTEPEEAPFTDRDELIKLVDMEVRDLSNHGDVLFFGDHGATELKHLFRMNRWLLDKGYLDFNVDLEFLDQAREYGVFQPSDGPGEVIPIDGNVVTVNEKDSVACCADPFSCGLTLLEGATESKVDNMIDDLIDTGHFERVDVTSEMWDGPYLAECPDLYPYRKEGVFVSSNCHPEKGGPEITRTGVHARDGSFGVPHGSNVSIPDDPIEPTALFDIIVRDFLDINPDPILDRNLEVGAPPNEATDRDVHEHLKDLGYI